MWFAALGCVVGGRGQANRRPPRFEFAALIRLLPRWFPADQNCASLLLALLTSVGALPPPRAVCIAAARLFSAALVSDVRTFTCSPIGHPCYLLLPYPASDSTSVYNRYTVVQIEH